MDLNVMVNYKGSEINGLFNEVEQLKKQRTALKEQIDKKTDKIIRHILEHGNVLAYKDNTPYILTVVGKTSKTFDKSQLATDTGVTVSELNPIGIAELVEEQKTSSAQLKKYVHEEVKQVLKARKAKKSDLELLRSTGRI